MPTRCGLILFVFCATALVINSCSSGVTVPVSVGDASGGTATGGGIFPTDVATDSNVQATDDCQNKPDGTLCNDKNKCTTGDSCQGGVCVGGASDPCESTNPCRTAACDPTSGCTYSNAPDGNACSISCFSKAECKAGKCQPDEDSAQQCPPSDNPCIDQLKCDTSTGECTKEIYKTKGTECDADSDICSIEECNGEGKCKATGEINTCKSFQKNNPCWSWTCNKAKGCLQTDFLDGVSCDDGNGCTLNDKCMVNQQGFKGCKGEPAPIDDGNPCTEDKCADGKITHVSLFGTVCKPAEKCKAASLCKNGICSPGQTLPCEGCANDSQCNDNNPCTSDKCVGDKCKYSNLTVDCDDGDSCTVNDLCKNGTCKGIEKDCSDLDSACTQGVCFSGNCQQQNKLGSCSDNDSSTCDDICVGNKCVGESCINADPGEVCETALTVQEGQKFSDNLCNYVNDNGKIFCGENGPDLFIKVKREPILGNAEISVTESFDGMLLNFRGFEPNDCAGGQDYYCWNDGQFGDDSNNPFLSFSAPDFLKPPNFLYFKISSKNGKCGKFSLKINISEK